MRRFNKAKFLTDMVEQLNYYLVDINVTSWNKLNECFTGFVAFVHSCIQSKHAPLVPASRKKTKIINAMDKQRKFLFLFIINKDFIHLTIGIALNRKTVSTKHMLKS